MKIKLLAITMLVLSGICTGLYAQQISGSLSGTLGPGTYTVVGDCRVESGQTLDIEPGTVFQHRGFYKWNISGTLNAVGNADSLIEFVREQPIQAHKWGGIRFDGAGSSNSVLDYCYIADCDSSDRPGGGIFANYADITVRNSVITRCFSGDGGGIYADHSNIVIDNCEISHCSAFIFRTGSHQGTNGNGGGVYLYYCNAPRIYDSFIHNNYSQGA